MDQNVFRESNLCIKLILKKVNKWLSYFQKECWWITVISYNPIDGYLQKTRQRIVALFQENQYMELGISKSTQQWVMVISAGSWCSKEIPLMNHVYFLGSERRLIDQGISKESDQCIIVISLKPAEDLDTDHGNSKETPYFDYDYFKESHEWSAIFSR